MLAEQSRAAAEGKLGDLDDADSAELAGSGATSPEPSLHGSSSSAGATSPPPPPRTPPSQVFPMPPSVRVQLDLLSILSTSNSNMLQQMRVEPFSALEQACLISPDMAAQAPHGLPPTLPLWSDFFAQFSKLSHSRLQQPQWDISSWPLWEHLLVPAHSKPVRPFLHVTSFRSIQALHRLQHEAHGVIAQGFGESCLVRSGADGDCQFQLDGG